MSKALSEENCQAIENIVLKIVESLCSWWPTFFTVTAMLVNCAHVCMCVHVCSFQQTRTTMLGMRSFFIAAPVIWNSLPLHFRFPSIGRSHYRAGLKTHLSGWPFTDLSSENYWRDCSPAPLI